MSSYKSHQSGFTMIELMTVMLIAGILAALSAPLIKSYAKESAAGSIHAEFSETLASARQMAVATGQTVALCASADGLRCSGDDWSKGWLVYLERDVSAQGAIAPEAIVGAYQIDQVDFRLVILDENFKDVPSIRFNAQGFSMAESRLAATMCNSQVHKSMDALLVERTGRIRAFSNPFDRPAAQAMTGGLQDAGLAVLSECQSA